MICALFKWILLLCFLLQLCSTRANYVCLCAYAVETPVYPAPSEQGKPIGYLYEFDCKPVYHEKPESGFQSVQMEKQVGYVLVDSSRELQLCQGSVPEYDKVPPASTVVTTTTSEKPTTTTPSHTSLSIVSTNETMTPQSNITTSAAFTTVTTGIQMTSGTESPIVTSASNSPLTTPAAMTNQTTLSSTSKIITSSTAAVTSTTTQSTASMTSKTTQSTAAMTSTTTQSTAAMTSTTTRSTAAMMSTTTQPIASNISSTTPESTTTQNSMTQTTLTSRPTTLTTAPPSAVAASTTTTASGFTTPTTYTASTSTPTYTVKTTSPLATRTTTVSTSAPVLVLKCKVGWTLFNGSCYLFHTSARATWNNANSVCKRYHAHLVAIETREEDMFIVNELGQRMDSELDGSSATGIWVGGIDHAMEGKWAWHNGVTGHDTPLFYTNWRHGEPDSGNGEHDEDCMCLIGDDDFQWQDFSCGKHMFYVCEMPPATTTQAVATASCPVGWVAHQTSCYYIHTGLRVKWNTAVSSCLADEAHLAIIETQNEQTFLQTVLHHLVDTFHNDDSDTGVWVAGTDHANEGTWMWHNAVTGADTRMGPYLNWRPGQPDTGDHTHDEDCMCLVGDKGFAWEDYSCGEHMFYICEKEMATHSQPGANAYQLSCPSGWTMYHESCYLFSHSHHLEWDDAGDQCRRSNAYLVEIETQDEQSFLVNQFKHILGSGSHEGFWAAGTDAHHEGSWVWMNTLSNRETTAINAYTNWRSGSPHSDGEDCLAMFANHNYQWEDHRCRNNLYHVCEQSAVRRIPTLIG